MKLIIIPPRIDIGCRNDQYTRHIISLDFSSVCSLIVFFPLTEALTTLSAVVIHTQNITRETPGFLLMSCLWNAYKTNKAGVCVCLYLHYICPCISSYTVDMKQPFECALVFGVPHQHFHCSVRKGRRASPPPPPPPPHHPSHPPGAVAVCLFSPVVGSLLSAHETDGVRLMGVFVALCQWRVWLGERSSGERRSCTQQIPTWGERERQGAMYSSKCQANFTLSFEMSPKTK